MKLDRKGFTLIELLTVIMILSLVFSISTYAVTHTMNKAKEKTYKITINNIEKEASNYLLENKDILSFVPSGDDETEFQCVMVKNLIDKGFLGTEVISSPVSNDTTVNENNYIYVVRNAKTKAVIKSVYIDGNESLYNNVCHSAVGRVNGYIDFLVNPDNSTWSREKDITIKYQAKNANNMSLLSYYYMFGTNEENSKTNPKNLNVNTNGSVYASILYDGETVVSATKEISKIDRVGPVIALGTYTSGKVRKEATLRLKVTDYGIGPNYDSFTKEDLKVTIGGSNITTFTLTKVDDNGNYELKVSDLEHAGKLVIKIDQNKVFDKLDNGNLETTLNPDITFSNEYTITYYMGNGTSSVGTSSIGTSKCTYKGSCTLKTWSQLGATFPKSENKWEFNGWSTTQTGTTITYQKDATFTYNDPEDINIYAVGRRTFTFSSGVAPTTNSGAIYQYWNPYLASTSYTTSINVPAATSISGWTFLGYRANDIASSTVTITTIGSYNPAPDSLTALVFRSIYQRTLTIKYDANGGTGTTSDSSGTQYYNSGYGDGSKNNGANTSNPAITLRSCGFSKDGYAFSKWADGSTSGTQYAAAALYTFSLDVSSSASTKTMYTIWTGATYRIHYYLGTTTGGVTEIGTSTCTYNTDCTLESWSNLGGKFPYSSEDDNTSYSWLFGGWSDTEKGTDIDYNNGESFKYTLTKNLNLYAIGKKTFHFFGGLAPTTYIAPANETDVIQYWNPYSTASTYLTSIKTTGSRAITGWTFCGFRAGSNTASETTCNEPTFTNNETTKPSYDTYPYVRSVYKRTLTISYNKSINSATGTMSNTTGKQYYNSGYAKDGVNVGANVSSASIKLASNGFALESRYFSKWADGSTSGTQYAAGANYSFGPGVSSTSTTKTMYAIWEWKTIKVYYNVNNGSIKSTTTNSSGVTSRWKVDSSGWVLRQRGSDSDYSKYIQTCTHGNDCNVANYNSSKGMKITRSGYHVESGKEWKAKLKNGSWEVISQKEDYGYTSMRNLKKSEEDTYFKVHLYVNWVADSSGTTPTTPSSPTEDCETRTNISESYCYSLAASWDWSASFSGDSNSGTCTLCE